MNVEKTLIISLAFTFYVFFFPTLVSAIELVNPATTLYPVIKAFPYILGSIILYALARFGLLEESF